jgi:hypothetical protein
MPRPKKTPAPAPTMSPGALAETVLVIAMQAGVPAYIYSAPGTGKTASARALTDAIKSRLHTIMLSVREPTDQGGLPAVVEVNGEKIVRLVPPGWARALIRDGSGTVFFDEVTAASPETMNSALRIVQEGVVGDGDQLPKSTAFILAGNPPETNVGASEITAGVANRCVHIRWPWDYSRWREGVLSRWAPRAMSVPLLPKSWRDAEPEVARVVIDFLDTRPELSHKQPTDISKQGQAWPSGRTWELTITMLAAASSVGYELKSPVASLIVEGLVGQAVCREWSSWLVARDLPSVDDVLADPVNVRLPKRADQVLAILSGVTTRLKQQEDLDTYMSAWELAIRVFANDASIAVQFARELADVAPPGAEEGTKTPFMRGLAVMKSHLGSAKVDFGSARR